MVPRAPTHRDGRAMNVRDPRVTQGVALCVAGIGVALSWHVGYQPAAQAYRQHHAQATTLSARVVRAEHAARAAGGEAAWLAQQHTRLTALRARFPQQSQLPQLLNTMVDTLKLSDMRLLDVVQGNVEPVQQGAVPLLIEGAPCYRLPVTITTEGRYRTMLQAMERLMSESFPALVSVEQVELRSEDPSGAKLGLTMRLYLYVRGMSP